MRLEMLSNSALSELLFELEDDLRVAQLQTSDSEIKRIQIEISYVLREQDNRKWAQKS